MRQLIFGTSCLALVTALSGCGNSSDPVMIGDAPPPSLVPVSSVVNAIKCELAETFKDGRYLDTLVAQQPNGDDVKASLDLTNVITRARKAEGGFEVVPLGITFGPKIGFGRGRETGQGFKLDFSYDLEKVDATPEFCSALTADVRVKGDPFIDMLEGVKAQYGLLGHGVPKVKLGTIAYTSSFKVTRDQSAGVGVKFLVFATSAEEARGMSEAQSLTLTFDLGLLPAVMPGG